MNYSFGNSCFGIELRTAKKSQEQTTAINQPKTVDDIQYPYEFKYEGNPLVRHHSATDPNAIVWDNKVWVYCSQDHPKKENGKGVYEVMDPYHHHVVIHNPPMFEDILGPASKYTGISLQTGKKDFSAVHGRILHWLEESKKAGKQWAVAVDEPGDAKHSLLPDAEDPEHNNARINGLWGAFMAGVWGTEWYFGYSHPHSDLTCQDYRSRDLFWDQCKYLLDFFENNKIEIARTENQDELVQTGDYCLAIPGELYIIFLRNGEGSINLEGHIGTFSMKWFDPRNGGQLQNGSIQIFKAVKVQELGNAPSEPWKDWVILLSKK